MKVVVNTERCKGCTLCVEVCPKKILSPAAGMNKRGVHPVEAVQPELCIGCGLCTVICPDCAITIYQL